MRKLASIQQIEEVRPITGADAIEHYRVQGWWIVDRKGAYSEGDTVVMCEIDSFIPHELAPFLSKGNEPKTYEGVVGNRLRTVRLRGALSQGLLLPVSVVKQDGETGEDFPFIVGSDVTELLGIVKWEPQLPAQLAGKVRGTFPGWARKTDQERIQTCFPIVSEFFDEEWVVEEKLDGSSMTLAMRGQDIHVCSRNLSIKLEDESNSFVSTAIKCSIINALKQYGRDLAISGELCGEGIQKNRYAIKGQKWFVFDIFDVEKQSYVSFQERQCIIDDLVKLGAVIEQVPHFGITTLSGMTLEGILEMAESKSVFNKKAEREGLVFKNVKNPNISFKSISNKFLLREE